MARRLFCSPRNTQTTRSSGIARSGWIEFVLFPSSFGSDKERIGSLYHRLLSITNSRFFIGADGLSRRD